MSQQLILASASPRRVELLQQIQVEFEQQVADIDETHQSGETPEAFVCRLALEKAEAIRKKSNVTISVLGSDTIVVLGDQILGKPSDRHNAVNMLKLLSGNTHKVMTAVSLITAKGRQTRLSVSDVTFMTLDQSLIEAYLETGESMDKAGAYAIQGIAAQFVTEIKGSYSGIMGLPLFETRSLLQEAGIKVLGNEQ